MALKIAHEVHGFGGKIKFFKACAVAGIKKTHEFLLAQLPAIAGFKPDAFHLMAGPFMGMRMDQAVRLNQIFKYRRAQMMQIEPPEHAVPIRAIALGLVEALSGFLAKFRGV